MFLLWVMVLGEMGCHTSTETYPSGVVMTMNEAGGRYSREWVASAYFDRAMGYRESRFEVISLREVMARQKTGGADAVILECRDDYEGLLTTSDIERYDLKLAVDMKISAGEALPGWLKPLLVIVPDGVSAPFQERFMTANIRQIRLVRVKEYYAPIRKQIKRLSLDIQRGFDLFRDNCLFCHSLNGVGGNKGVVLQERYDFARVEDSGRFRRDFAGFHHPKNPDKQNMEQFVDSRALGRISKFLGSMAAR